MMEIAKLGGILLIITGICSGLVGFVSEVTKEPIAQQEAQTKALAMQEVLPSAQRFEELEGNEEIIEVYMGIQEDQVAGYAMKVAPKGYGGTIEIMVGITRDGVVDGVKILTHSETPGLGANAADPSFTDQFRAKDKALKVVKGVSNADDEISAITGATITSDAIAKGVNAAISYVQNEGGGAQ